ncbi:hypothetical protein VPHD528_0158 [Vibrio phage D528]
MKTQMYISSGWTSIIICPQTKDVVSDGNKYYGKGICESCGHNDHSTITHARTVSGKWVGKGRIKKFKFVPKEELDAFLEQHKEEFNTPAEPDDMSVSEHISGDGYGLPMLIVAVVVSFFIGVLL